MKTKVCSKCNIEKDVCEFGKKITNKDGLQSRCKECRKIETKQYREKYPNRNKELWERNKVKLSKNFKEWYKKNPDYSKKWREKNKEKVSSSKKKYYLNNKEKEIERRKKNKDIISEYNKLYREKNKEKLNELRRNKRKENPEKYRALERELFKNNPNLKLIRNYRTRIKNYMKFNKFHIGTKTLDLVGLSPNELKEYLQSKFLDGMTWDNYGLHGWHIDHIIPLSSAKNEDELRLLCHYTNLQPLWSFDNLSKGCKI